MREEKSMNKKLVSRFSIVLFLVLGGQSIVFTQIVPYLESIGYNSTQQGILLAFYSLVAMFAQIYAGFLCDKYGKIKFITIISTLLATAASVGFYALPSMPFFYHLSILALMAGMHRVSANLCEMWVFETESVNKDFGIVRSFGSLGWAIGAFISGFIAVKYGFKWLGYITVIIVVISYLMMRITPEANLEVQANIKYKDSLKLFKIRDYNILLGSFFLVYFVYNSEGILIPALINILNGNAETLGIRQAINALSELPLFIFIGPFMLRKGSKKLMLGATMLYALKMVVLSFTPNVYVLYAVTIIQGFTFPIFLVALRDMVSRVVTSDLKVSSQMMATSLTNGLSSVLAPLFSGILLSFLNVRIILLVYGVVIVFAYYILTYYKGRNYKE